MNTQQIPVGANQRVVLPDIIKGVAVILMVQVHLMELFASEMIYNSMIGKVSLFLGGPPAAPVFMAVMGYFLASSGKRFSRNLLRGAWLILLGLLLNIGMNANLLIKIYQGSLQLDPLSYIFGVDILFLAGLSIILTTLFKLIFKEKLLLWMAAILVFGALNRYLPEYSGDNTFLKYFLPCFSGFFPWSYFPVFPWMAYVLVGFVFRLAEKKNFVPLFSSELTRYVFLLLFLILAITLRFGFRISTILEVYYHHNVLFALWTIAFLGFWFILFNHLNHFFGSSKAFVFLQWVGKNVTIFYVVQWLLIGNIATEIYRTQSLLQLMLWFVSIMVVTSVLVWGMRKIHLFS